MYGTVARMRMKSGMEERMRQTMMGYESAAVPGMIGSLVYQLDADPKEYLLVVVFKDKETYFANANSPEQNARYEDMLTMLDGAPEWHDGEILPVSLATRLGAGASA
jgi:quinol monooxygenase YgiN